MATFALRLCEAAARAEPVTQLVSGGARRIANQKWMISRSRPSEHASIASVARAGRVAGHGAVAVSVVGECFRVARAGNIGQLRRGT